MENQKPTVVKLFDKCFCFESYGVVVRIESDAEELLGHAFEAARSAVVGEFKEVSKETPTPHSLGVAALADGTFVLLKNGAEFRHGTSLELFLKYFDSAVRLIIAEFAVGKVFLHAGVVGWSEKAIVIPGDSFNGKSTLVAELVRRGAAYFSDEYAVFDENGVVHPFPRKMALRSTPVGNELIEMSYVSPEDIGGRQGTDPLPVGVVLLTRFEPDASWKPELLTPGQGVMEMISQTIPIRYAPEFSMKVLKNVAERAIIVRSLRPDAAHFAESFLEFVDNKHFEQII
jgi:hypothetical protein